MRRRAALLSISFLTACGGGGADPVVDAPPVAVTDAWAASSTDVWAVGGGGGGITSSGPNAMHYDGVRWEPIVTREGIILRGVWGTSATDVWAVGEALGTPIVLHFDGLGWALVTTGLPAGSGTDVLNDVWGSSASDVWVVGYTGASGTGAGLVYHFDGSVWSVVEAPAGSLDLRGVHVTAAGVVLALDRSGAVFRRDGSAWARLESGLAVDAERRLDRIGDAGDGTVFVGGAPGFAQYDGTGFVAIEPAPAGQIRGFDAILSGASRIYTTFDARTSSCDFGGCSGGYSTREATVHIDSRTVHIETAGEPTLGRSGTIVGARFFVNGPDLWVLGPSFWRISL